MSARTVLGRHLLGFYSRPTMDHSMVTLLSRQLLSPTKQGESTSSTTTSRALHHQSTIDATPVGVAATLRWQVKALAAQIASESLKCLVQWGGNHFDLRQAEELSKSLSPTDQLHTTKVVLDVESLPTLACKLSTCTG